MLIIELFYTSFSNNKSNKGDQEQIITNNLQNGRPCQYCHLLKNKSNPGREYGYVR